MLSRARSKLTYANVMATVAVFLALGGGIAWALAKNSVKSKHIAGGQVKSGDLSDSVEGNGFSYVASTGEDLEVTILDARGYEITASCESVGGRPLGKVLISFPEDGRIAALGAQQHQGSPTAVTTGYAGVDAGASSQIAGAIPANPGQADEDFNSSVYVGQTQSAAISLHLLADDTADLCRATGVLTPGITSP